MFALLAHHNRLGRLALPFTMILASCGGDGPWNGGDNKSGGTPGAPSGLEANAGDGVVSLGWLSPTTGTAPFSYKIDVSPASAQATITQNGTTALVSNLSNGVSYTFSITASNNAGQGGSVSVQAQPSSPSLAAYAELTIQGDNSPSGILDPAPLRGTGSGASWMAYAGANAYSVNNQLIQDVAVRLARSDDGGRTFVFVRELGTPQPATVTDSLGTVCGGTCTGRWEYGSPWLVDDSGDPNSARRFKLFAHKYFFYPPSTTPQQFRLGAIVLWTASAPDGTWSAEQIVLGWNFTPSELTAPNNFNALDPALSQCQTAAEGSASVSSGALDFAFSCAYDNTNALASKIVLLRSLDHANTFRYITTLLQPSDAAALGAAYFSTPALLPSPSNAPVLIATPVVTNAQGNVSPAGCRVFPIANESLGSFFRDANNAPIAILALAPPTNTMGSGCGWDRGLNGSGILMNSFLQTTGPFTVEKTNRAL